MARPKLTIAQVRVPTARTRATLIKAKFDDLDNYLDTRLVQTIAAAGAILPANDVVYIDATSIGMALTLADGTIPGQAITIILRSKTATGTAVVTPATAPAGSDTATFDAVGERVQYIWVTTNGWTARPGATAAMA